MRRGAPAAAGGETHPSGGGFSFGVAERPSGLTFALYLPPALTVLAQLIMALVAGILGVALATLLAAAGVVLLRMRWVEDVLGEKAVGGRQ